MARRIAHKLASQWRSDDVLQTDENATFELFLLSERVLSGLRKSGFVRPSPIQVEAIPLGLCGFDLVVQAKSGTGKTCVFSTLALQRVDVSKNAVQVLILAPTREIAVQSCDTVCCIGCDTPGLKAYAFIGGVPIAEDLRKLSQCHVAAGTLGRLLQLVKQRALSLTSVGLVVLDEADQLLNESFESDLRELWSRLPPNRQVVATSATYPPEVARTLEEELLHQPAIVRLGAEMPTLLGVTQWYCVAQGTEESAWFSRKLLALVGILRSLPFLQCLVFLNSQARAQSLAERLSYAGFKAELLSGAQDQSDRLKALVCLKAFRCRILVSTDLGARGIDAERVNLVVNFDVARDLDTHLHRSGRAGRYGTVGQTITLVTGRLELDQLLQLCSPLKLDIRPLPGFPSLEPGDGETGVNGHAPEDDPGNCTVNDDVAEHSSSDFEVNDVANGGHSDDCDVKDSGGTTDTEEKLEGMVPPPVKDVKMPAAEHKVLPETVDPFQVSTEPSPIPHTFVQCQQPEPVAAGPTPNGEAVVVSSSDFGVNEVAGEARCDDHEVSDGGSTTDTEENLEGMLRLPVEDAKVPTAEDKDLRETTYHLEVPTEPSPTLDTFVQCQQPEPTVVGPAPNGEVAEASSGDFGVIGIAGEACCYGCEVNDDESAIDPEQKLKGMLRPPANEVKEKEVLPETTYPLEPSPTLDTFIECQQPEPTGVLLTPNRALAEASSGGFGVCDVAGEASPDDCGVSDDGSTVDPEQELEEVQPPTVHIDKVPAAKYEILPYIGDPLRVPAEPSPTINTFVERQQVGPTVVEPTRNKEAAEASFGDFGGNDHAGEACFDDYELSDDGSTIDSLEGVVPPLASDVKVPTVEGEVLPKTSDPLWVPTGPSQPLDIFVQCQQPEPTVGPTWNGEVAEASSSDSGVNDVAAEARSDDCGVSDDGSTIDPEEIYPLRVPSPTRDTFVQCQQPEPGLELAPNGEAWCNLSWPPEPSMGVELAAHIKAAKEAFYRSFGDSSQLEQMQSTALKDYPSSCSCHTDALDGHVSPVDDVFSVLHAMAAADELFCTSEQRREPSLVALYSESAGTEGADAGGGGSCPSHNWRSGPTAITLEGKGLSRREDISSAPNGKAAAWETLHAFQLQQEAGLVASNSDAASDSDCSSEDSFVTCCSHEELSSTALESQVVSVAQAQRDNFVSNSKTAAGEVPCPSEHQWEASLVTLNSDITRTEAVRKKGCVSPRLRKELIGASLEATVPILSHAQNGVISALDVKAIAHSLPCSSQKGRKLEMKSEVALVKDANVRRKEHPSRSHNPCFDSNGLNQTKAQEKRSTQGSMGKCKDTANWIMEYLNLTREKKDQSVTAGSSRLSSASLKLKQPVSERVDVVKDEKVRTPQKSLIQATTTRKGNSSEWVRNVPGTTHQERRQLKVDPSSESEESDGRECSGLPVQHERHKQPSYPQSSQIRYPVKTYLESPANAVTSPRSYRMNRGPTSRTDMCDRCTLKCEAIRTACCEAQRSSRGSAVSSFPYSWTQMQASGWSQNWFQWYQWYLRAMLQMNGYQ